MHIFKGEYTIIYTRRNKFNNKKEKKNNNNIRESVCVKTEIRREITYTLCFFRIKIEILLYSF